MSDLMEFLTSKEIICVYIIIGIALIVYFTVSLIDRYSYKRRRRQNTRELNRLVEQINEKIVSESPMEEAYPTPVMVIENSDAEYSYVEPIEVEESKEEIDIAEDTDAPMIIASVPEAEEAKLEQLNMEQLIIESEKLEEKVVNNVEELKYVDVGLNPTEAQLELKRLTEELEKASSSEQNIDLTAYEEQQEATAIISIDELIKKSKEMYANNEISQYEDEGNEPISLKDLELKMQEIKKEIAEEPAYTDNITSEEELVESVSLKPVYQAFKSSPFISPIYGIEEVEKVNDIELENTANYEKLDEEIKKTNEFLMTLRELRKNLE